MTQSAAEILSRDLFALADEAGDHLKDAARKSGTEATEVLQRSTQAITRAADRLRDQAETSAVTTREQVAATVRAYPVTAGAVAAAAIFGDCHLGHDAPVTILTPSEQPGLCADFAEVLGVRARSVSQRETL